MAFGSTSSDTIFALSSAPGRAGVAVVRISGDKAGWALEALASGRPEPRHASLRRISDPETASLIDRGLVIWFPAPATFTGEDMAEFQVHGGRAVIAALLTALGRIDGCRLAEPGEFAMRAFDNGRIDLAQAEGLADLIDAETEAQRSQALRQAEGALTTLTERWRSDVIDAMALVEAAIDFSDEADVSADAVTTAEHLITGLHGDISAYLDDARRGEILRDGFRVVLAGGPNVGKSSLLNALARRDVAIVSSEAGTTRDVIEVRLDLEGLPVIVSDTAGLREATGEIEEEGIRRTLARTRDSDLIIWVVDASEPKSTPAGPEPTAAGAASATMPEPSKPVLIVANKADLLTDRAYQESSKPLSIGIVENGEKIFASAKTGHGLAALTSRIADIARTIMGGTEDAIITQARHRQHLTACVGHLGAFSGRSSDLELRAEDLRLAADALGRISGRVDPEDVLDQVFGRFCIGK